MRRTLRPLLAARTRPGARPTACAGVGRLASVVTPELTVAGLCTSGPSRPDAAPAPLCSERISAVNGASEPFSHQLRCGIPNRVTLVIGPCHLLSDPLGDPLPITAGCLQLCPEMTHESWAHSLDWPWPSSDIVHEGSPATGQGFRRSLGTTEPFDGEDEKEPGEAADEPDLERDGERVAEQAHTGREPLGGCRRHPLSGEDDMS